MKIFANSAKSTQGPTDDPATCSCVSDMALRNVDVIFHPHKSAVMQVALGAMGGSIIVLLLCEIWAKL